jgi:hypothetical protein
MRSLKCADGSSVNVALRLDAALGRVSSEDQRIIADAIDLVAADGDDSADVGGTRSGSCSPPAAAVTYSAVLSLNPIRDRA